MARASASTGLMQLWSYLAFPRAAIWAIGRASIAGPPLKRIEYKETKIVGKSPAGQGEFTCLLTPAMPVARIEPDRRFPFRRPLFGYPPRPP